MTVEKKSPAKAGLFESNRAKSVLIGPVEPADKISNPLLELFQKVFELQGLFTRESS
jgi:hypothetical protein